MLKGSLSREDAINQVGVKAVEAVERENCEPTNRVGYNGACQNDSMTEWVASISASDHEGEAVMLSAFYYTTRGQDAMINETGDGGPIDWEVSGYEVL